MLKSALALLFAPVAVVAKKQIAVGNDVQLTPYERRQLQVTHADLDTRRRPVIGVLTEPLRGYLKTESLQMSSYVPRTHVQFLEQAGVRVVPIDYRLPTEERWALYDQLNGVYFPGDSQLAITDEAYKLAFVDTLSYQESQTNEQREHFPLFLMGSGLSTYVRAMQSSRGHTSDITQMRHRTHQVKLIAEPSESYLFQSMTETEKLATFNKAQMFNKETTGVTLEALESDKALNWKIKPLAVFEEGDEQIVAIAEGIRVPLYAFTYGLDLVQFYFENATLNLDEDVLDHSLVARTHAQYMAHLIADESRLSSHEYTHPEAVFQSLIRHQKLATIHYQSDRSDQETLMPIGMRDWEVYYLQ